MNKKPVRIGLLKPRTHPTSITKQTFLEETVAILAPHVIATIEKQVTTRRPRPGDERRGQYIFVSEQEFQTLKQSGSLSEDERLFNNSYGTLKTPHTGDGIEVVFYSIDTEQMITTLKGTYPDMEVAIWVPSNDADTNGHYPVTSADDLAMFALFCTLNK